MKYTIEDVAKEAKVSISTVSRVLNNNYPVKKETRKRIEEAIKKLDYKPNPLARGLVSGKSNIIGVLVPNLKSLIYTEIISFIENKLSKIGYDVMITTTDRDIDKEEVAIRRFLNRSVDGIIIVETELTSENEFVKETMEKTPIVFVNEKNKEENNVYVNNKETVESVIDYLLNLGHTKVAILSEKGNKSHEDYIENYIEITRKNEMYPIIFKIDSLDLDDGSVNIVQKVINKKGYDLPRDITAFIVCDDLVMVRSIGSLYIENLSIPNDVSVINLKNTGLSGIIYPSISAINVSPDKIANSVVSKLIYLLENKEYIIDGEKIFANIVERESCKNRIRRIKEKEEVYFL